MPPFNILLADPPWQFDNVRTGGSLKSGAAQKYDVLSTASLAAMKWPLTDPAVVAPDALLFLWATVPMLPEAMTVMAAWDFRYKTLIPWHKTGRYGTGFWFRGEVELLLLGVRGKVKPFRSTQRNYIEAPGDDWVDLSAAVDHPRLLHSEKPEIFREIIDAATAQVPNRQCLELFARRQADGWTATGLDLDGLDVTRDAWWEYLALAPAARRARADQDLACLGTVGEEELL